MIDTLDKSTVVSIYPLDINESKPGIYPGEFKIPAAINGEPSILVVGQSVHHVDVGDDRPQLHVAMGSAGIAKAVVDDFIAAQLAVTEDAYPGIAWLRGELSVQEIKTKHASVLAHLKIVQRAWYVELFKLAADDWEKYRKHNVIADIQRIAARALGRVDVEWVVEESKVLTAVCPACNTQLAAGTVVCPQCRCVIDKDKYAKLVFAA